MGGFGDGDFTFAIGQTDDQQLMSSADLRAIHDQTDFAQMPKLCGQPLSGNRCIPVSNSNSGIIQEPTQATNCTQKFSLARNFASDPAQCHRTTLIDPDQQPGKVANLGDPMSWSQFSNSLKPSIILAVDRHSSPPGQVFCSKSTLTGVCSPINYSFGKVSGS